MTAYRIEPASEDDFARFYHGIVPTGQWTGRIVRKGRLIAGFGGAMEVANGVWFAFLDIPTHVRTPVVYRHIRHAIAGIGAGAEIRAVCDVGIPRAKEMLERLGFEPTDEEIDGKAVWHVRT